MYVREKVSLCRHTFSFSVHIPRSLLSNDTHKAPQCHIALSVRYRHGSTIDSIVARFHVTRRVISI